MAHYYPYGGILSQSTNQGVQKYKYNGQEFDCMHGLDMYNFGARQQDPETGMFTSMDPLCEKYYNISPYSYCAGSPIRYVNPTGMVIEDMDGLVAAYKTQLNENIKAVKKSLETDCNNETGKNKFRKECYKSLREIRKLEKSKQIYSVSLNKGLNNEGDTQYDFKTNKVMIEVGVDGQTGMPLLGHELVHGYQFETGKISFDEQGQPGVLYEINDEVEAYTRQYILEVGQGVNDQGMPTEVSIKKEFPDYYFKLSSLELNSKNAVKFGINLCGQIFRKYKK